MSELYTRAEIEQLLHAKVKKLSADFTGNVVVSKYKDEKIFKFPVAEEDVKFFRQKFVEWKNHNDLNYVEYSIKESVKQKLDEYDSRGEEGNILEAYLYALKLEDGCFGTTNHSNSVNQNMLEAYEKAITYIYENRKKSRKNFYEVMKHTLVNWESYQPLLLAISFFGNHSECGDEEIDEIMRSHLLYRKIFSKTTLYTLCARPKKENFEELLKFIVTYNNKDKLTETLFNPDNSMVDRFINTLRLAEYRDMLDHMTVIYQTLYKNKGGNKDIRNRLDRFFGVGEKKQATNWQTTFSQYRNYSSEAKEKVLNKVLLEFKVDKTESRNDIVYIADKEILDVVGKKIEDTNFVNRCWGLIAIGKNKNDVAKSYLRNKETAKKYDSEAKEGFAYKVACFIQFERPSLEDLCEEYFCDENMESESQFAPMLKLAAGYKRKSDVLNQYLKGILEESVRELQDAKRMSVKEVQKAKRKSDLILKRCKHYFVGKTNERMYPGAAMKTFLRVKMEQGFEDNDRAILNDVISIIRYAATNISGKQYESMLLDITAHVNENSAQFTAAKQILQEIAGS